MDGGAVTARSLADSYELVLLDLDGVVYIGGDAIPHAVASIAAARGGGTRFGFITNNASRTPGEVAEHLRQLGVAAAAGDVVNSAQAAASMLAAQFPVGSPVAVLGTTGLRAALTERGLVPVAVDDDAVALVSGYGPEVPWRDVMRAASRIKAGLPWVAANTDASIPTPYGEAPGHGAQVDLLARFSGVTPPVAGKPALPLFQEARRRLPSESVLMVGDRLDTDIAGAYAAGLPSLLVLTGVTSLAELVSAVPSERPTYLAEDLRGLAADAASLAFPTGIGGVVTHGGWTAVAVDGELSVSGTGPRDAWWRAAAAAAWHWNDTVDSPVCSDGLQPPGPVG